MLGLLLLGVGVVVGGLLEAGGLLLLLLLAVGVETCGLGREPVLVASLEGLLLLGVACCVGVEVVWLLLLGHVDWVTGPVDGALLLITLVVPRELRYVSLGLYGVVVEEALGVGLLELLQPQILLLLAQLDGLGEVIIVGLALPALPLPTVLFFLVLRCLDRELVLCVLFVGALGAGWAVRTGGRRVRLPVLFDAGYAGLPRFAIAALGAEALFIED